MDGIAYEAWCAAYLKRHGYRHVTLTPASGDQGVDIVAEKHGVRYGFQCKYYTKPVGNRAVQEVFAGMRHYNCDRAVVMTNATFTPAAEALAESTQVTLWPCLTPPAHAPSARLLRFCTVLGGLGLLLCGGIFLLWPRAHPAADPAGDLLRWAGAACLLCGALILPPRPPLPLRIAQGLSSAAVFVLCYLWQGSRAAGLPLWLGAFLLPGLAAQLSNRLSR